MADVNIRVTAEGANEVANIFKGLGQSIEGMGGTLKRVFETAAGVQLATSFQQLAVQAAAFAKELVALGLEAQRQNDAFERMTASLGVNSTALATALETASRGIIDVSDVMTTAIRGLQEGLNPDQLVKLMEIATTQAQVMGTTVAEAYNTLTTAIINHNERALKTAGITIDAAAAYEQYATSMGKSADQLTELGKSHAIYLAVVEKTGPAVAAMSQEQLTNSQATEKAASAWKNFKDQLGIGIVDTLGSIVIGIKQATAAANEWSAQASTKYVEFGNTLAGLRDKAVAWGASMVGIAPALATTTGETVKLGEAAVEASRGTSMSARGLADMGTNAAAAAPHFKTTAGELDKMAREAEKAAEAIRKADEALIEAGQRGWVEYAEAVFKATEAEQLAEVAITDRARAQEAAMMEKDTAGWVAYADAVFAATEAEQQAEVAITDRARAQADAALKAAASARMMSEGFDRLTLSAEDAALELAILTDSTDAFLQFADDPRWDDFGKGLEDMFLSVTDTFSKMATGLIQGTLDIGDAFANLGQSLLANFVQVVIHQVFDPILKEAAAFVTSLIRMGASAFDGFLGGAGGGGGSAAGGRWVEGSTGIMEWQPGPSGGGGGAGGGSSILGLANLGFGGISGASSFASAFPAINSAIVGFNAAQAAGEGFFSSLTGGAQSFAANLSVGTMGTAIAGLGAILSLYTNISALMSGDTAAGIGGLSGMALGAIGGAAAGTFLFPGVGTLAGGLVGAGIGGALGNMLGGLFGGEDWDAIHAMRAQQRQRTGITALAEAADKMFDAESIDGLVSNFKHSMMGTGSRIGDVIQRMLADYSGTEIGDLGTFEIPEDVRARLMHWFDLPDFEGADFSSGRVGSIQELIAATGIENWEEFITGLDAFISVLTTAQDNLDRMRGVSFDAMKKEAVTFFETLRIADELGEAGFHKASESIKATLRGIAEGFEGGIAALREAAITAIMADPIRLLSVVDVEQWQRVGEEFEETTARVGESLLTLGVLLRDMKIEIDAITGSDQNLVDAVRNAQALIDEQLVAVATQASRLTAGSDPTEILAVTQQAYDLVKARYELEIRAVQTLMNEIQSRTEAIASAGTTLAQNAEWLMEAGTNIGELGNAMAEFGRSMPLFSSKVTALGSAIDLFAASMGRQGQTGDVTQILKSFVDSFTSAMQINDPGDRLVALTEVMNLVGQFLGTLPEEQRKAMIAAFGPEIQILVEAIKDASAAQAAEAARAAEQLNQFLADSGALNVQNFMVQKLDEIAQALTYIYTYAGDALYNAIDRALDDHGLQTGTGPMGQPGGLYKLHAGEIVVNPEESAAIRAGQGYYGATGYRGGMTGVGTVTLSFGDIHLARGGRQEAEEFIATVEASIKHGRLRDAVQRAAVGQA